MSEAKPIRIILITGFLGAGKTTLLNQILKQTANMKIGIIENEFGEVGVDGTRIEKARIQDGNMIEINNGSMFCSCRHGEFIEALKKLADYPLDMIIIEATGVADPAPLEEDIRLANKWVGYRFRMAGNICIVDTVNFLALLETLVAVEKQICYAHFVLLNKVDLAGDLIKQDAKERITALNPEVSIIETEYCKINFSNLIARMPEKFRLSPQPSSNSTLNKPLKLLLEAEHPLPQADLLDFFNSIRGYIYRIKGYLTVSQPEGTRWMFIDGVRGNIGISDVDQEADILSLRAQLVAILPKGSPYYDLIGDGWKYLLTANRE